jgi:hypothetical protein
MKTKFAYRTATPWFADVTFPGAAKSVEMLMTADARYFVEFATPEARERYFAYRVEATGEREADFVAVLKSKPQTVTEIAAAVTKRVGFLVEPFQFDGIVTELVKSGKIVTVATPKGNGYVRGSK